MFPRSYFPSSNFPPSFFPKAMAPQTPMGRPSGGGGQIFDMEAWYPTDSYLVFPDYVYSIPPAETQPVEETTTLVGTAVGTGIQITGTLDP